MCERRDRQSSHEQVDSTEDNLGTDSQDSTEEGEMHSSDDEDVRSNYSSSSSVKILRRSAEEIAKEKAEMENERQLFLDQAVDKTFQKLTEFMKESGMVINPKISQQDSRTKKGKVQDNSQMGVVLS